MLPSTKFQQIKGKITAKFLSLSTTEVILIVYQKIAPDKKVCSSLSLFLLNVTNNGYTCLTILSDVIQ